MDLERRQRSDIDTVTDNRLTQDLDSLPLNWEDYSITPKKHEGNNWLVIDNEYVKYSIAENDTLAFVFNPVTDLSQKDITEMTVSFDYDVSKAISLDNISLSHDDMSEHENVNIEINGTGHVDASCNTFGLSSDVLNSIISGQAFNIGLNLVGDKSNASVRLSNVEVGFKFNNKLLDESNSVVNRLVPQVDFYREGSKLILQIGDGTGKGHVDGQYVDTYTKEEIDAKLLGKVDAVIGKGLSTNDYTGAEKNKLSGVEDGANYYVHPASHGTTMIVEPSALSNIGTSGNASQYDINNAIDGALGNKANTNDIPVNISDLVNDSDFIEKSNIAGLVKNDGTVDTTQYLSSLPTHNHDDRYYTESEVDTALNGKQATLISGTNIKTINNTSLLGSGNISIQGGGSVTVDSALSTTSENPVQNKVITGALNGKANSSSLSTVATSGSYNDLSNKPSIPTKTSDLNNDSGFITSSSLPTKTSDLTNDGSDGTNAFVSTNDSRLYDTGWQDMAFPTGFGHYSSNQKAQYRRIGKIVHLRGAVKNTNAFTSSNDASNHIATISDTTCRPSAQNEVSIQQGSGQNRFLLTIDTNGKLYCARYGTTSNTQVNASAWLNINCTFMVE